MTHKLTIATLLLTCASLWAELQETQKADLIIYGGTSTAVMAGVQASQMGKSVIIVSPDKHLGGLSSGGLGWTDNGHAKGIGGLSRQFYQRIKAHYDQPEVWRQQTQAEFRAIPRSQSRNRPGDDAMWIFEPHVAEKLFDQYIAENNITVVRDAWLDREKGVTKDGTRIISITTLAGEVYQGEVFIDATYEGDLMAAAGVRYHVGREANSVYNETINGVQKLRRDHPHHFDITGLKISPYKVPGDPKSGLLPRMSAMPIAADGTGDHRIQAYCFRACLTNDPDNRIPFPKPDNYDPEQYEILLRVLQAGWPEFFRKFDPAPNKKTDQNNHGPFSTDNIGHNYDYPEASYESRREIIKAHEDYQKGLMYFVANDPRVPKDVQNELRQWGLPKDEFVDNGHWSHQLYIREARRMIGQHIVTEHDVNNKTEVNDSIGMGVYTMDSHNVQRHITADGFVENEGNVGAHIRSAYPIPFGAILPKPEECTNLLVPGAISSSHIAFGSLRMEPTFMILGQSAGTAAAFAIDKDIPVQDIDYQKDLKPRLLADEQRLEPNHKQKENAKKKVSRNTFMVFGNTYITTFETKTSILASINKAVKDADIDFVIMVGELTIGATVDQFKAVKYVIENSPVPVHVTASNHDLVYANGDWKSGISDDYARFRKMLETETEYTMTKGRSHFIMQSHTESIGVDFTKKELAKLEGNTSYDFVYHVMEASLGAEIDRKNKPMIGINGGSKEAKYHVIGNRHIKVVPIENKKTDNEDDYLIFKENEGYVVVDSYVDRSLDKSFKIMIDRSAGTCSVER